MTLKEIIEDLHAIEPLIQKYEKKYNLLSEYFYKLYQAGKLEERWDFIDWAGLYQIKLRREKKFEEFLDEAIKRIPSEESIEMSIFK